MEKLCIVTKYLRYADGYEQGEVTAELALMFAGFFRVTIMLIGGECPPDVVMRYNDNGITIVNAPKTLVLPIYQRTSNADWLNSYIVMQQLKASAYDIVVFFDFKGLGFHSIQAKRVMGWFKDARLCVLAVGASYWKDMKNQYWGNGDLADLEMSYMERYSLEHADILVSPTQYMLDWYEKDNVPLAPTRCVIPLPYNATSGEHYVPDVDRIALWAHCDRWIVEKSSGIDEYIKTLTKVGRKPDEIVFILNRQSWLDDKEIVTHLTQELEPLGIAFRIQKRDTIAETMDIIKESKLLVVFPYLEDNQPIALRACMSFGIPFDISKCAGLQETAVATIDIDEIRDTWIECLAISVAVPEILDHPLVSVCMSHYNHKAYLGAALKALKHQDYDNYEVLICDDGSTDAAALENFRRIADIYADDSKFNFYEKENEGLGESRNWLTRKANGEYFVFVDTDNVPHVNMLSEMVACIQRRNADCLTCSAHVFNGIAAPSSDSFFFDAVYIGGCPELGLFVNCYGDANSIIKKASFMAVGGFSNGRIPYEDWALFTDLCMAGKTVDTISAPLYLYRRAKGSMGSISQGNDYFEHLSVLKHVLDKSPTWVEHHVINFVIPRFRNSFILYSAERQRVEYQPDHAYRHGLYINGVHINAMYMRLFRKLLATMPKGGRLRNVIKLILRPLLKRGSKM